MRVDYAAYPDKTVPGSPRFVFSRGELVIDQGQHVSRPGHGRFVRRSTFSL